jgi:hypothetical protein
MEYVCFRSFTTSGIFSLLALIDLTWSQVFFFFNLVCEAIGTAATPGLLRQSRKIVRMIVEKQMECRVAGETEVLRENLPQRHFCPGLRCSYSLVFLTWVVR